jgi:hypothetical protein
MRGQFTGEARAKATRAVVAQADRRARALTPITEEIRATGVHSYSGIAAQLEARGIRTARGGRWAATQVRDIVLRKPASPYSATIRANIMDKKWEDLIADEKLEYPRLNMAEQRRSLLGYAADFDVSLRQLNERLIRLEETLKK